MKINPAHCHCKTHTGHQCPVAGYRWMRKGKKIGYMCAVHARHALRLGWKPMKTPAGAPLLENYKTSTRFDVRRSKAPRTLWDIYVTWSNGENDSFSVHARTRAEALKAGRSEAVCEDPKDVCPTIRKITATPTRKNPCHGKRNPRTVPTKDEIKRRSLGALNLGGEVYLWLVEDPTLEDPSSKYYWFAEDDGDYTAAGGTSIANAVAAAKKFWPKAKFFPKKANPPMESWIDREKP